MGKAVTLTATPGPAVSLRWGARALAVADPWFAPGLPGLQQLSIGQGEQSAVLSTVAVPREGYPEPVHTYELVRRGDYLEAAHEGLKNLFATALQEIATKIFKIGYYELFVFE